MTAEQLEELLEGGDWSQVDHDVLDTLARRVLAAEKLVEALTATRSLVSEASAVGFNCYDGDWAERLFSNNGKISRSLTAYREASK